MTQGWIESVKQAFDEYCGEVAPGSRDFLLRIMELSEVDVMPPPTVWITNDGFHCCVWHFPLPTGSRWVAAETPGDGFLYYRLTGKGDAVRKKCHSSPVDGFRMMIGWARGEDR